MTAPVLFRMSVYPREDRRILRALRLCVVTPEEAAVAPAAWPLPGIEAAPFRLLAGRVREAALNILLPDSPFVSEDEAALLSLLTPHQRQESPALARHGLAETAIAARETMRNRERSRQTLRRRQRGDGPAARAEKPASSDLRDADGLPRDLRSRAIELTRRQAIVSTTEFGRFGISRQYLHALRKSGVIESAGYGRYRQPGGSG